MDKLDSVWVVDDDESIRWVLEKGFSENNISVLVFKSAHEVIKKLEESVNKNILLTLGYDVIIKL